MPNILFPLIKETDIVRKLLGPILTENVYEYLVLDYLLYRTDKVKLNASTIGRLILMLTESLECESEPEKAFANFCSRVESIKRDKELHKMLLVLWGEISDDTSYISKISEEVRLDLERRRIHETNGRMGHKLGHG